MKTIFINAIPVKLEEKNGRWHVFVGNTRMNTTEIYDLEPTEQQLRKLVRHHEQWYSDFTVR